MARIDFRVQPGFFHHPKTICLQEVCGQYGILCLLRLWAHAAENAPDGNLESMSDDAIETAAGWTLSGFTQFAISILTACGPHAESGCGTDAVLCGTDATVEKLLLRIHSAFKKGKFVAQLRNSDSLYLDNKQLHDWQEHQPFLATHKDRSKSARHAARMRWACAGDAKTKKGNAPSPSPSPLPSPSPSLVDSSKPETPVAPPLDFNQKREMDWLLKAIRLMAGTSRTFQTDLMAGYDLDIKFTKWAAESGGVRWIIFCAGIMWRRVEVYNDGLNDPFACALPKPIESPMSYLHSLVFPEKNDHQPTFTVGEVAYREERTTEWWFKTFFAELDEGK